MPKKLILKRKILLFPKKYYSLKTVNYIQNNEYNFDEFEGIYPIEVLDRTLNEFIEMCNDEGFIMADYWIAKVKVFIEKK